jgi:hypothetical protein
MFPLCSHVSETLISICFCDHIFWFDLLLQYEDWPVKRKIEWSKGLCSGRNLRNFRVELAYDEGRTKEREL